MPSLSVDRKFKKSGNFTCKVITELDSASHSQVSWINWCRCFLHQCCFPEPGYFAKNARGSATKSPHDQAGRRSLLAMCLLHRSRVESFLGYSLAPWWRETGGRPRRTGDNMSLADFVPRQVSWERKRKAGTLVLVRPDWIPPPAGQRGWLLTVRISFHI